MNYLLDTNICIFYMKNKFNLIHKLNLYNNNNFFISEITLAELLYGIENSVKKNENYLVLTDFLKTVQILPINNSLSLFAFEKSRLKKLGLLIDNFDLLIGTSAVGNNMILVTNNTKHLARISNIHIEDWTIE